MSSKLKQAREAAGYSIDYIGEKLNIRKQYLVALEEGNYDIMPGKVYTAGYKKMYYEFLGITDQNEQNNNLETTELFNTSEIPVVTKKYTKYIIICSVILLALVVALYDFFKVQREDLLITTQSDDVNDGSRQQSSDIPYKTD